MAKKKRNNSRLGKTINPACPPQARLSERRWLWAAVLVAITFVAYQPVWHAGFIWDDDDHVINNATLRSLDGLQRIWFEPDATPQYYPLVHTSFWFEYHLWGIAPLGYHLINVLLHALNAVLLWRALQRLDVRGAWWASAIFALHPVTVESVAWVTERKNVLSGLFYLLAMLAYLRFRPFTSAEKARTDWRFYPLLFALFVCALLSKTVTCSLPAVILLVAWWKRGRVDRKDVLASIPLFVVGLVLGLTTAWLEKTHVGASGNEWSLSFIQQCLLAGRALWFYAAKLVWPNVLIFIYPRWNIDAGIWWQYFFPLGALGVVIGLWLLRPRLGKAPLVAVLIFAGTLFPALGFFDIYPFRYSFVADHFQYLACIGIITLMVNIAATISQKTERLSKHVGPAAGTVTLMVLGVLTWRQGQIYRDIDTLWQDTLTKNPNCSMANQNLGGLLALRGKVEDAIRHCENAIRVTPNDAGAHYNYGVVLFQADKIPEAILQFEEATRLQPNHAEASCGLGAALARIGKIEEGIRQIQKAKQLKPDFPDAFYRLGDVLLQMGKIEEARIQYEEALRLKPGYPEAQHNLGVVCFQTGKIENAIQKFEEAVRLRPDYAEAHKHLGVVLLQTGKVKEAIAHYEQAIRAKSEYSEAQIDLAYLLATLPPLQGGDTRRALTLAQQACKVVRGPAPAYLDTLAITYAAAGRFNDAVDTAQKAVEMARAAGQSQLATQIEARLKLYRTERPYRP